MKKLINFYNKLEEYLLVSSLVATVTIIFYQVIMRFVFNDSPSWTEEIARYIFIWQIWLGTSVALKEEQHIRVELIKSALIRHNKLILKNVLELFILLAWITLTIFLTVDGFHLLGELAARHALSAGLRIPLMYTYASVPVSCLAVSLRLAARICVEFRKLANGGAA
jgi:TRAP-type C4-dicarboxylate transport system permease small subunit